MKAKSISNYLMIIGLSSTLLMSCKDNGGDDTPPEPQYNIPTTYNFDNVSYDGQIQRLSQFFELKTYMAESKTQGVSLDASRLIAMYENDSVNAQWQGKYEASKQLKNKTQLAQQPVFTQLLQDLATSSTSTVNGEEGKAGVVTAQDASTYLLNANGVEEAQLIEKGLMGACLYYQIAAVYLGEDKMNVDNTKVTPGSGTEMEHHWDEAFGYFGVPVDFSGNTSGTLFWGKYSNSRDAVIQSNTNLMNAFLKGRAAISNNDLALRDVAISDVRSGFEKLAAASAIHYLKEAIASFDDMAKRAHYLSEATAFIYALQFNPNKSRTNTEITGLIATYAGSNDLTKINFYQSVESDVKTVLDQLAVWYDLENEKDAL